MTGFALMWRLMRPRQWLKSGFIFLGLLFAHAWHDTRLIREVCLTALAFSLIASSAYVLNDILDRESDLQHPLKKHRPIAAKEISVRTAVIQVLILWMIGLVVASTVSRTIVLILLGYIAMNIAYSLRLKHVVILDVFIIAAGFMLRILAGTSGVGINPSQWLLICGLMVALFLGFAKRRAELYAISRDEAEHRRVLRQYQPVLLDNMIVITATCVIMTYSLYTMSPVTIQTHKTDALIYTVPFVMYGIFRYIYSLHNYKTGSDPAQEIFRDPHILFSIGGWLILTLWLIS